MLHFALVRIVFFAECTTSFFLAKKNPAVSLIILMKFVVYVIFFNTQSVYILVLRSAQKKIKEINKKKSHHEERYSYIEIYLTGAKVNSVHMANLTNFTKYRLVHS